MSERSGARPDGVGSEAMVPPVPIMRIRREVGMLGTGMGVVQVPKTKKEERMSGRRTGLISVGSPFVSALDETTASRRRSLLFSRCVRRLCRWLS